jgi:branched-chain amino acid aminotransferase
MSEPLVFLNDRFVPANEARVAIWDAGVVQGATVAEMTRTFGQRPFRLDDHLDRLFRALRITRMDIHLSKADLADLSLRLLDHNIRLVDAAAELGLVHFVTAGEYGLYAWGCPPRREPTVCVHTFPLPFSEWRPLRKHGVRLIASSIRQVPPLCWDAGMKCRSRMHYYLAQREVRDRDPDAWALLLDMSGNVTETNSGNFLMVENGVIVSPPADYTLPGISRAMVRELAEELRIPFMERDISLAQARRADEALLSGTSYCLLPVAKIDEIPLGDGRPGPVYRQLLDAWSRRVGVDIEKQGES